MLPNGKEYGINNEITYVFNQILHYLLNLSFKKICAQSYLLTFTLPLLRPLIILMGDCNTSVHVVYIIVPLYAGILIF